MSTRSFDHNFSRRRLLLGGMTLVGSALVLQACGGSSAPADSGASQGSSGQAPASGATQAPAANPTTAPAAGGAAASGEKVNIKFHARQGQQEDELYKQRIPEFEEKYPNIKATLENFPGAEYYPKIATMAAGGTIGDSIWTSIGGGGIYFLAARKTIAPIDDFVSKDKFDLTAYYPGTIKALTREGKVLGLPFKSHPGLALIYYNKKIFDDAKVEYPTEAWTHDDLIKLAQELTKSGEHFGYLPTTTQKAILTATRSFGGELLSEDGKKAQLSSKEGVAAIQFIASFFTDLKVAPTPDQVVGDANQMWINGKLAMFQGGTSVQVTAKQIADKFEFFAVPNAKGPAGVGGSDFEVDAYAVVSSSKHKDEAWELVKWLTDQESGIRLGEIGGTVGGRQDVYTSERLLKDPIRKVFADVMANAQATRPVFNTRMDEYEKTMQQMLDPVWLGKEKPTQEFIGKINDALQKVLDKPLP